MFVGMQAMPQIPTEAVGPRTVVESTLSQAIASIHHALEGLVDPAGTFSVLDLTKAAVVLARQDIESAFEIVTKVPRKKLRAKHRRCIRVLKAARNYIRTAIVKKDPLNATQESDLIWFVIMLTEFQKSMHICLAQVSTDDERRRAEVRFTRGYRS